MKLMARELENWKNRLETCQMNSIIFLVAEKPCFQVFKSWERFHEDLGKAEKQSAASENCFAFSFVEGALVKVLILSCLL